MSRNLQQTPEAQAARIAAALERIAAALEDQNEPQEDAPEPKRPRWLGDTTTEKH